MSEHAESEPAPPITIDANAVLAERVSHLYSQLPIGIALTFVIGALASYELWELQLSRWVGVWWAFVVVVTVASALLYVAYRRSESSAAHGKRWLSWLSVCVIATGVGWGLAAAVFFPLNNNEERVFLTLLLVGVTSVGIALFAASWPLFAAYAASIVAPFTYVLATSGSRLFAEIALVLPFFYVVLVGIAHRLHRVLASGYRVRQSYRRLMEENHAQSVRMDDQMQELIDAHRVIQASGRKLQLYSERAPIAVFEMDSNGTILDMNPAAETMFGHAVSELVGRNLVRTLIPQDEAALTQSWWAQFAARMNPEAGIRVRCLRRDGLEIVCEFSLTPLVNDDQEIVSVIAQCRDITQQIEAERVKKEFTSTLSHELRTPLTSIIGSLQLINTGMFGTLDQDAAELALVAERNAQRLLDLINDILDLERIDSGRLSLIAEDVSLDDVLQESVVLNRAYAERFGVRLKLSAEPLGVLVHADRRRLLQVMTNLISNAAKFSPEGGQVELSASCTDARIQVSVEDRGPGIPQEFRSRIFGRFAQADSALTRKKGGTGLGLAICKRLIELMGGEIWYADREGGGTSFHFRLPAQATPARVLH
jgi:PAS domain S-box-containing protein